MCGLTAIFAYHGAAPDVDLAELRRIRDHMAARGPDGVGEWLDERRRVGLGHRRLSIIDLSARANQPMASGCGRYLISFNGEIYNYRALRQDLEAAGCRFRTSSDTEVVLELYARQGRATFGLLRGMFALALWDRRDGCLLLARDPYGIKPLYYADDGRAVRAASQVKALLAGGRVSREPAPAGIVGFFTYGSVPEPWTCWREIRAVPAGCLVRIDGSGPGEPETYCDVAGLWRDGERSRAEEPDPPRTIRAAVRAAVRDHLVADVPVGLFLSAGVDSGALLGIMADLRPAGAPPVRTVTLAFEEYRGRHDDEAPLAEQLAATYGAEHATRRVDRAEFESDLPAILEAMDQPSIDGVNSWFVSKAAHEHGLKVALSGLGGDELFGGYPSFRDLPRWVLMTALPSRLPFAGRLFRHLAGLWSRQRPGASPKLAGMLELGGSYAGAYLLRRGLFMPWELSKLLDGDVVREGLKELDWRRQIGRILEPAPKTAFARVAALEACLYMRNQLLRDTDWASMAHSLEVRVPLVDATLLRTLAPVMAALGPAAGKRALAGVPARPLPEAVTGRAKTGFTMPFETWLGDRADGPDDDRGRAREPWARRWARMVARHALPRDTLRRPREAAPFYPSKPVARSS